MYINKKPSELGPYSQTALCFPPSPYPHLLFTAIATAYPLPKKATSSPRKFPAPASFHCPPPTTSSSTKNPPGKSSAKNSLLSSNPTTPTPAPRATDRRSKRTSLLPPTFLAPIHCYAPRFPPPLWVLPPT